MRPRRREAGSVGRFGWPAVLPGDSPTEGVLVNNSGLLTSPKLVPDGQGGAIISWAVAFNGHVFAQRVNSSGTLQWASGGVELCKVPGGQSLPLMVADGTNGAIIAWSDARAANPGIYARRITFDGLAQWDSVGTAICTAAGGQSNVIMVDDASQGALITWVDQRNSGTTGFDVYAQRVTYAGAPLWTPNGVAVCSATANQIHPALTGDGVGGALVGWEDYRQGTNISYTYAMRIAPQGGSYATGVSEESPRPGLALYLHQNHPNPFNPRTKIGFDLTRGGFIRLSVYEVSGRLVSRLVEQQMGPGRHEVVWDGMDRSGRATASGVYVYRLEGPGVSRARRMVLLR